MSTVFIETLKPLLNLLRISGVINFCCVVDTSCLRLDKTSTQNIFLEIIRTFVYLFYTYRIFTFKGLYLYSSILMATKYWTIVITARTTEKWMLKFVNGIIEFDRKLYLFSSLLPAVRLSPLSKRCWSRIIGAFFAYFAGCQLYYKLFYSVPLVRFVKAVVLFHSPDIIVFVVVVTSCFCLYNLGHRFRALNAYCAGMPAEWRGGGWTDAEETALAECLRLLHAQLAALLRTFSRGFGPVLLVVFASTFVHASLDMYLIFEHGEMTGQLDVLPYVFFLQYVVVSTTVLGLTSWVIDEKENIISHLRSMKISEMSDETRLQVKMFMRQTSNFEQNELTASGFFGFNLNLLLSILALMITGLSTLFQMQDHPFILYMKRMRFFNN